MLKLSHLVVKRIYADRCNLIENRNAIWSELKTQYCRLRTKEFRLRKEACIYFTIGLFILVYKIVPIHLNTKFIVILAIGIRLIERLVGRLFLFNCLSWFAWFYCLNVFQCMFECFQCFFFDFHLFSNFTIRGYWSLDMHKSLRRRRKRFIVLSNGVPPWRPHGADVRFTRLLSLPKAGAICSSEKYFSISPTYLSHRSGRFDRLRSNCINRFSAIR